jgi:hypothetical protein
MTGADTASLAIIKVWLIEPHFILSVNHIWAKDITLAALNAFLIIGYRTL